MFDEPDESPSELARDPAARAREKSDEFRMHAELAAVFEGTRKFGAQIIPGLDAEVARNIQKGMSRLDKLRSPDSPVLPIAGLEPGLDLLNQGEVHELSTNDYHVHRRPGEVMIVRWLTGDEVGLFYDRLQAHFDAALAGYRDDERSSHEWKQDESTLKYLAALDAIEIKMADTYLREIIREHSVVVLSTQTADEINIAYLTDHIMEVPAGDLVGSASAPPEDAPTEQDLAWFFKLFCLRGIIEGIERMCFFTYLQKSGGEF